MSFGSLVVSLFMSFFRFRRVRVLGFLDFCVGGLNLEGCLGL